MDILDEVKKLIEILEKSNLKKISVKRKDNEIFLEKESFFIHEAPLAKREVQKPIKEEKEEGNFITSPMVGTFYTASAPNQPPLVKIGQQVDENTVVCIIEAMKVMNEVKANRKGVVKEVLVENAQPVEFGSKLFRIE